MLKNCPSCGRPVEFDEKYAKVLACRYCNSILEFWSWELDKVWEQAEFIEFPSIFEVWKVADYNWKRVYVKWQLRYEYDWGFFDKFYVEIDWKSYYIKEDDWIITILQDWEWQDNSEDFLDEPVWTKKVIFWIEIFIQETWVFKLVSMKWYVNNKLIVWKDYEYLDWIIDWKMYYFEKIIWQNKVRVNKEIDLK